MANSRGDTEGAGAVGGAASGVILAINGGSLAISGTITLSAKLGVSVGTLLAGAGLFAGATVVGIAGLGYAGMSIANRIQRNREERLVYHSDADRAISHSGNSHPAISTLDYYHMKFPKAYIEPDLAPTELLERKREYLHRYFQELESQREDIGDFEQPELDSALETFQRALKKQRGSRRQRSGTWEGDDELLGPNSTPAERLNRHHLYSPSTQSLAQDRPGSRNQPYIIDEEDIDSD